MNTPETSNDGRQRPEWLTEGATIAEYTNGRGRNPQVRPFTQVERFTKTLVVLANGRRYPIDKLKVSTGSWDPTWELRPADDPAVVQAIRHAEVRRLAAAVQEVARKLEFAPDDADCAASLLRLVPRLNALLGGWAVTGEQHNETAS